jgi:hypothetical protein
MASSRKEGTTTSGTFHTALVTAVIAAFIVLFPVAFMAAPAATDVPADSDSLSEEDGTCLSCHSDEGLERATANGETLSLHVRGEAFARSVHNWIGCAGCHTDVDLEDHLAAEREINSPREYAAQASRVCSQCHSGASLKDGPEHHAHVSNAGGPACAECHEAHSIGKMGQWKASVEETAYCLTCHGRILSVPLGSSEAHSLYIDEAVLRKSVHLDHDCTDCHIGFSKEAHEVRASASERKHSIVGAEVCRQCHEDKFELYQGSVHAALIDEGDLAAPVCTDCHGSHSVGPTAAFETITGVPCKKCHEAVFEAYAASVHNQAWSKPGHFEAPVCADCHRAHDVRAASVGDRLKNACLGCHMGAMSAHQAWLPNAERHLEVVSCPACHAPAAQRRIDLRLYDSVAQELVSEPEGAPQFANRVRSADANGDGLDAIALWKLLREFNRDGTEHKTTLRGRLEVRTGVEAHRLSDTTKAVRDCDSCHSEGAEPFQSVAVSIVGADGRSVHYGAQKEVLTSVISVDSVGGFYAIGGTRIKLLDILLVLALFGGISVPIGHLTVRWLFRKFLNKGAKEDASKSS